MKHKTIIVTLFCCLLPTILAQNKIKQMEYWINDNISNKQILNITPSENVDLNTTILVDGVPNEMSKLHFRFVDTNNKYSQVITHSIYGRSSNPKLMYAEYWFDDDYASREYIDLFKFINSWNLVGINLIKAPEGMHFFNIRFRDMAQKYSAIQQNKIYISKNSNALTNSISEYRYWLDDNIEQTVSQHVKTSSSIFEVTTSPNISTNDFSDLHNFKFQLRDTFGLWSGVVTLPVLIRKGSSKVLNVITGYRYWLNDDFSNARFISVNSSVAVKNILENIDLTMYQTGSNHTLKIQFQDASGLWSAVQSTFFRNAGGGTILFNALTGYRYWYDGNFSTAIFREINPAFASVSIDEPFDMNSFIGNNRKLYFQFLDASGLWSVATIDTVTVKNTLGIEFPKENQFKIFPNPNKGEFIIAAENEFINVNVVLFNSMGQSIFNQKYDNLKNQTIRLSDVPTGLYYVQIIDNKLKLSVYTSKIIITK